MFKKFISMTAAAATMMIAAQPAGGTYALGDISGSNPDFFDFRSTSSSGFGSLKVPSQRRKCYATGTNQRKIRKLRRQTGNYG